MFEECGRKALTDQKEKQMSDIRSKDMDQHNRVCAQIDLDAIAYNMEQMKQGAYIDIPLFYYPGYRAEDEHGEKLDISKSETNLVRVFLQDKSGSFLVFFKEPVSWRMAECISILAATWLAWELLLVRKRNYGSKEPMNTNIE